MIAPTRFRLASRYAFESVPISTPKRPVGLFWNARVWAILPPAVLYGGAMTPHSCLCSSASLADLKLHRQGDFDSLFFSGRAQATATRRWTAAARPRRLRGAHGAPLQARVSRLRDVEFPTSLHEALRHLARFSQSLKDHCREYRAAVQMCAHAPDQICAAARALVLSAADKSEASSVMR
jgi:hypothetical protein